LEVTTILFGATGIDDQLVGQCRCVYDSDFFVDSIPDGLTPTAFNVVSMIKSIRGRILSDQDKKAYALLVFDAILRQLSGLGFQPSPNKISNPSDACCMASWISSWLLRLTSSLTQS
jgi:hypothetical protein